MPSFDEVTGLIPARSSRKAGSQQGQFPPVSCQTPSLHLTHFLVLHILVS